MNGNYHNDDPYGDEVPVNVRVPEAEGPIGSFFRRLASIVAGILATCFVIALLAGGAYLYLNKLFEDPGPLGEDKVVDIARGTGLRGIAEQLLDEGIISNDKVFILGVLVNRADGRLRAGEYRFEASYSMRDVMDTLVSGRSIQYAFTAPEGLTTMQIVARLEADENLQGEIERIPAEGALLPDTYAYTRGTTRQSVLDRMSTAQEELIRELWPARQDGLPIERPYEALILASIVEKETGVASERDLVASVFINRLNRGMRLQSDPTIIYGIVGGEGSLGRPITRDDINTETPYNTYRIDGLPPTPIANAGRASIAAVLQPAESNYVYFVADGTGGHAFAETLAEHNRNVANWREIESQRRAEERAEAAEQGEVEAEEAVEEEVAATEESVSEEEVQPEEGTEPEDGDAVSSDSEEQDETVVEADGTPETAGDDTQTADQDAGAESADDGDGAAAAETDAGSDTEQAAEAASEEEASVEETAAEEEIQYPLPQPKPEVPDRQSSVRQPSDITVVPLPATEPE